MMSRIGCFFKPYDIHSNMTDMSGAFRPEREDTSTDGADDADRVMTAPVKPNINAKAQRGKDAKDDGRHLSIRDILLIRVIRGSDNARVGHYE